MLKRLAEGKVYKQIAHELESSTSTVRTHLHNTYAKLGAVDRAQAVLIATERGWSDPAGPACEGAMDLVVAAVLLAYGPGARSAAGTLRQPSRGATRCRPPSAPTCCSTRHPR